MWPMRGRGRTHRVGPHGFQGGSGLVGRDDGDELALVGHVERVDAQQVARAGNGGLHRKQCLVEHDGKVGVARKLVGNGTNATARRIAQPTCRWCSSEEVVDEATERGGVRADVGFEGEVAASQHDRHPVVGDRARYEHDVTGAHPRRPQGALGTHDADSGRADVDAVGRPPTDHFGVAGDDGDASDASGRRHVGDDGVQVRYREPFLDDERRRQPRRPRAHHGEVVDGAVHGEVADRAAREPPGLHHEGVG